MTPDGQRQVDAAKADGRWAAADAPMRAALDEEFRTDLRMAISEVIGVDAAIRHPCVIARVDCHPLARFGNTSVLFGA
jgi:hypothetical protein